MATNVNILDKAPNIVINGLNWILKDDPKGLERPLWRDVSRHNGHIDFSVLKDSGVTAVVSRTGISWGYQDPWFPRNWSESKAKSLYRSTYHVPYPDQPVIPQLDSWYKLHPELDTIPRVIDLELSRDQPSAKIAEFVWGMSNVILSRDGVRPIIYSRYLLVNDWLRTWTKEMLNDHYWWLAQYLTNRVSEHPGPPTLPLRLDPDRVILHQTADKKAPFSGESKDNKNSADWNRWCLGNEIYMRKFIESAWGGYSITSPVEPLYKMRISNNATVRRLPDGDSESLGILYTGCELPVVEEVNGWCRVDGYVWSGNTNKILSA
jgi:hypothetical protein